MMTLAQMLELGCYVSAGHVDHYGGKHTRIAEVLVSGDLIYEKGGEDFINKLSMSAITAALGSQATEIPTAAGVVAAIEAPAPVLGSLRNGITKKPVDADPLDDLNNV